MKKIINKGIYMVTVGAHVEECSTWAQVKSVVDWYMDYWFNYLGGMGTPIVRVTDLRSGEQIPYWEN